MLTGRKSLTINRCSGRVFKMIEFKPIKLIYINSYNILNKLVLFEGLNAGAGLGRYCLRGE
jgi:hypothetical protein